MKRMRLSLIGIGILVSASVNALAEDAAYRATLQRIRAQEGAISGRLNSLRTQYGFPLAESSAAIADGKSEMPSKILKVHGEIRGSFLPTGKLLFGRTLSRLVVASEGTPVLLELDDRQGAVSGLRVLGTARPASNPGRVQVDLQKLLLPSRAISFQGVGLDPDGAQGLVAEVFSSKAWAVAGAMAGSFISGLASAQQTQSVSALGFSQTQPTGRNAILQGVAQTAADQSKRLIEEATAEKPVLVVDSETPITVLIQEEVRF